MPVTDVVGVVGAVAPFEALEPLDEGISLANSFTNSVVNSCLICVLVVFNISLT